MSQLFDSLRRGRQSPGGLKAPRTAHGDAVLATLGYAPTRRGGAPASRIAGLLIVIGAVAAGWTVWRVYSAGAEPPTPVRPSTPHERTSSPPASPSGAAPGVGSKALIPLAAPIPPAPGNAGAVNAIPQTPAAAQPPPQAPARPLEAARMAPRPKFSAELLAPPREPARPATVAPATLPASTEPVTVRDARAPSNDLDLALYYHRAGDFENALQHYRALLQKNELDAQAHNNLGLLYQGKNLLEESARELSRAILIEPGSARMHNNYGATLLRQGRVDEAAAEFQTALELDPRGVDALVNLALAEKDRGHPEISKEMLLRALTIAPGSAEAHYNLAVVYDETNEPARAVDHYRKFLEDSGAARADRAASVRARVAALSRMPD